jgi:hypothetical protein
VVELEAAAPVLLHLLRSLHSQLKLSSTAQEPLEAPSGVKARVVKSSKLLALSSHPDPPSVPSQSTQFPAALRVAREVKAEEALATSQ